EHRTSNIEHRTSNIEHRTSNIEHRTSNIKHRTSNIKHQTSNSPIFKPSPQSRVAIADRLAAVAAPTFFPMAFLRLLFGQCLQTAGCETTSYYEYTAQRQVFGNSRD
ncbi:MAG TPA: hypothetical protein EYQ50_19590, partial [Verrucomicrobiales bacterium]|nr:hypothetical protein [Verrucomicrobiales bacterium]